MFTEACNAALTIVVDEDMELAIRLTLTDQDFLPIVKADFPAWVSTETIANGIINRYADLPKGEVSYLIDALKVEIAILTLCNKGTIVCQN